ncbi:hypothetical protein CEP54_012707 [Fusarium duplospermum]|uniref:Cucumopine synthase C-terminal helical bundle domain-containing protein n=1 Tax=Fusarium duplospermum TaxID=1325734 RepID=A0A428P793_9HYPO|nr:hypothetical protein CEP54_012707 [Fusarium duplospermum]
MDEDKILEVRGPGPNLSFRMKLLHAENPDIAEGMLGILPWESFLLHVVVAGETIYIPAPSISLKAKNMVPRGPGVVYFNTTSQSICLCYGVVTERRLVNQFAQVLEEDLPRLVRLGKVVFEQNISCKVPKIVPVTVALPGTHGSRVPSQREPASIRGNEDDTTMSWEAFKAVIDAEIAQLRLPEEPDDIKLIRLGAVQSRAGGESSPYQTFVFLQGFLSTLGPHVFSRLLAVSNYPEMTTALMVRQTREFLFETLNHFDFLADLGLTRTRDLGKLYATALEDVKMLEDYRSLTNSMRTMIQLLYRWVHLVFPWFVKDQF